MSVVIDASVLVAALIDSGEIGRWAEDVVASGDLLAPHLLLVESTNILRRQQLGGEIESLEASAARVDLTRLQVELFPFAPFAERVWELRDNVTSYDAWYVAVAEGLEAPLATLDTRLSHSPGPRCEFRLP